MSIHIRMKDASDRIKLPDSMMCVGISKNLQIVNRAVNWPEFQEVVWYLDSFRIPKAII